MAYTLNTSHPLYGSIVELIGVQSGALVSHKTARNFTKHASATYGSGSIGEYFKTGPAGWSATGASLSPEVTINETTTPNHSIFIVFSNVAAAFSGYNALTSGSAAHVSTSVGFNNSGYPLALGGYTSPGVTGSSSIVNNGVHSVCTTKTGESAHELIVDGVSVGTGGKLEWNSTGNTMGYIGGVDGQGCPGGVEFVWIAVFNKVLSASEALSLHNSLGANNAFGLVQSSGGSASTTISATLANIAGSVASKSNPKTAILATLANVTASVGHTTGTLKTTIAATLGNIVGSITSAGSTTNGTFTSEVLKDYAGNVLANTTLNFVRFYNDTTGALVLNKTGVSTNGSGIVTFSDAALVAGITYRVDWETAAGSRRMPRKAAA